VDDPVAVASALQAAAVETAAPAADPAAVESLSVQRMADEYVGAMADVSLHQRQGGEMTR